MGGYWRRGSGQKTASGLKNEEPENTEKNKRAFVRALCSPIIGRQCLGTRWQNFFALRQSTNEPARDEIKRDGTEGESGHCQDARESNQTQGDWTWDSALGNIRGGRGVLRSAG